MNCSCTGYVTILVRQMMPLTHVRDALHYQLTIGGLQQHSTCCCGLGS